MGAVSVAKMSVHLVMYFKYTIMTDTQYTSRTWAYPGVACYKVNYVGSRKWTMLILTCSYKLSSLNEHVITGFDYRVLLLCKWVIFEVYTYTYMQFRAAKSL